MIIHGIWKKNSKSSKWEQEWANLLPFYWERNRSIILARVNFLYNRQSSYTGRLLMLFLCILVVSRFQVTRILWHKSEFLQTRCKWYLGYGRKKRIGWTHFLLRSRWLAISKLKQNYPNTETLPPHPWELQNQIYCTLAIFRCYL